MLIQNSQNIYLQNVLIILVYSKKGVIMGRIKGIGGVFFKCQDADMVKEWYREKLGMITDEYGAGFTWYQDDKTEKGFTQWSPFESSSDYFDPSKKEFMINYIVEDLETLKTELESKGVKILDEISEYEYGKFLHILDPEGNKVELWEPKDPGILA